MVPEWITTSILRRDLIEIVAATSMASLAIAALAVYALRRRSADLTLLTFSASGLLYSARMLTLTDIVPVVVGGPERVWNYGRASLTYAILVSTTLFAESLLGAGWRGGLRWLRRAALVCAPLAVAGMFVTGNPEWAMRVNNAMILSFIGVLVLTLSARDTEPTSARRVVLAGVLIAAAFVVAENLRSIGFLPWPPRIEFIGILTFVCSIAFAVADRVLRTEGRIAAVDRELATARRIQQAILPERVPSLERFDIDVQYVPMTEVAGDFYDFLHLTRSRGTILIADVSGHGVPAALIASMVKIAAASHGEAMMDPGRLLSALSHTLHGQLGGQFLTAMCLHLDGDRGEFAYAGAGHPPLLHYHAAERRLEALDSDGVLIGLLPSAYGSRRQVIEAGDRLLLYTDGVLETTNRAGEFFGDHRFHAIITEHASGRGGDLARTILDEMTVWSGRRDSFDDDVTLVVIEAR